MRWPGEALRNAAKVECPKSKVLKDGVAWAPLYSPSSDNECKFGNNGSGKVGVPGTATVYVEQETASSKGVATPLISCGCEA